MRMILYFDSHTLERSTS